MIRQPVILSSRQPHNSYNQSLSPRALSVSIADTDKADHCFIIVKTDTEVSKLVFECIHEF